MQRGSIPRVSTMKIESINFARDVVMERLSRAIPDEAQRYNLATAITTQLDMCKLLIPGQVDTDTNTHVPSCDEKDHVWISEVFCETCGDLR